MNKVKKYNLKLDYTEDELQELRKIGMVYDGPIAAVYQLGEKEVRNDPYRNLRRKYRTLDLHKEFDFMTDINNVVMGTAIFPEKKYVVHDKVTDRYVCFNAVAETFCWSQVWAPEKKTKEEWLAINPAYELMLESIED